MGLILCLLILPEVLGRREDPSKYTFCHWKGPSELELSDAPSPVIQEPPAEHL